jgi:hypothetical protein
MRPADVNVSAFIPGLWQSKRCAIIILGMRLSSALFLLIFHLAAQNVPDLTGVWRMDLGPSPVAGEPPRVQWIHITQAGSAVTLKSLIERLPANAKHEAIYSTTAPQTTNWIRGNPTKSRAAWSGSTLRVESSYTFGKDLITYKDEWTRRDENTLEWVRTDGAQAPRTFVLKRQPASAVSKFSEPEKPAKEAYKNIQSLGVPASSILSIMNTYSYSLGVTCDHCHNIGQWESDEKPAKATARKMIVMTRALNQQNFAPRVGVSCYTCHRGNPKPSLIPPD